MVEALLAARGIAVGHEIIRRWTPNFARTFINRMRRCCGSATNGNWTRGRRRVPARCSGCGGGGPPRDGARHPAPEPARHGGREAPDTEAAEKAEARAARAGRGQVARYLDSCPLPYEVGKHHKIEFGNFVICSTWLRRLRGHARGLTIVGLRSMRRRGSLARTVEDQNILEALPRQQGTN
jgi:hypothetical protein